jgi:tetratricopeptide (TPR) repeat protein
LARENAPGNLLTIPWLAELSQLLPELRERSPDLPFPSHDEAMARTRLFESVARLGQALAKRAPLVVFIDDLQWADASSLDLLHYVCRRWGESKSPVLLIFSLRSEALEITPELAEWLSGLGRDLPVTRLALDPLTPEETLQLIRSLAPEEVSGPFEGRDPEWFGHWLYAETGGQPFFIMETLKTLLEQGLLAVQPAEDGAQAIDIAPALRNEQLLRGILPAGVREVIAARLARLPSNAQLLLTAGAVSSSELSQLFLQLGWAYELRGEFAPAKSIYEELLTLAQEMHEPAIKCAALNRLATLAAQNNQDLARAEDLLQQALAIAESSGNKAGVAETAWNLAQTGFYAGKISESLPHAERALALARELDLQELIGRSLHALATLESALGKWEEGLSHAEEARMLYATLGNRPMEVGCLCVMAVARFNDGQTQEGIDAAKAALAISVEIEDHWGQINASAQMARGLLDRGAYSEALSIIQQGVALARALEITPLLVITLVEWGNVSRAILALEAAQAAHSEALARCESFIPPHYAGWMAGELCADYALAEQWQPAYTCALKAEAMRGYTIMHGGLATRREDRTGQRGCASLWTARWQQAALSHPLPAGPGGPRQLGW